MNTLWVWIDSQKFVYIRMPPKFYAASSACKDFKTFILRFLLKSYSVHFVSLSALKSWSHFQNTFRCLWQITHSPLFPLHLGTLQIARIALCSEGPLGLWAAWLCQDGQPAKSSAAKRLAWVLHMMKVQKGAMCLADLANSLCFTGRINLWRSLRESYHLVSLLSFSVSPPIQIAKCQEGFLCWTKLGVSVWCQILNSEEALMRWESAG